MKKRSLCVVLGAAALASVTLSKAADSFTCPVTLAAPVEFSRPSAWALAGSRKSLFGTERLFTIFPGNWNTTQKSVRGYRVPKTVWGSAVFDLGQESERNKFFITGRRLDVASAFLEFDRLYIAGADGNYFIISEFYVPTLGCWEVTGHFHGSDLTIVTDLK